MGFAFSQVSEFTNTGTAGAWEDAHTYTLPANSLGAVGDFFELRGASYHSYSSGAHYARLEVGGNALSGHLPDTLFRITEQRRKLSAKLLMLL